ncbi:MAG: proteasome subunit beta, partial [Actinomycetota bacterium]|nr:proteasome subunit beta [Actinomycetota bacterium]
MTFPLFSPGDDPGPSFAGLLRSTGALPPIPAGPVEGLVHGTTVVAVRYGDGVVMAGARRATSG